MSHLFLLLGLGTGELIVIALVILLFFGAAKLPELMKGLGKGIKSFKQEMNTPDQETAKTADKAESKETPKETDGKAE
ncbi:MAG: twin-arginine translocase TatA/TatE family subunit [Bacteroidales bacterium]|nr:twin-arginine translocase TatA/TatE family subunit [Bacteroidales bacterium]